MLSYSISNSNGKYINDKVDYQKQHGIIDGGSDERENNLQDIQVAELRVRLPPTSRWVNIEKCRFLRKNRTLDTRLTFPDLTLFGKVMVHPRGMQCNMILRLRRAGIEFRTIPIVEEHIRTATVRTDSYFSEPGFISVYAHGCDGRTKHHESANSPYKHHTNSNQKVSYKRNGYIFENDYSTYGNLMERQLNEESDANDIFQFNDDILNYSKQMNWPEDPNSQFKEEGDFTNDYDLITLPQLRQLPHKMHSKQFQNIELADSEEIIGPLSSELEYFYSRGVRGLLTSYMQKALQPAIKATLMESLGYTLSYG